MPPLILLVHGFNVANPEDGIGRLRPLFELHGFEVDTFGYGRASLADVLFANDNMAESLLGRIRAEARNGEREVIPVGHSNGCYLIHRAAQLQDMPEYTWEFDRAAYLSPAVKRKARTTLLQVDVFHSRHDLVVGLAAWLPWNWGDMGQVGAQAVGCSYVNHDATGYISGHSAWWGDSALRLLQSTLVNPMAERCGLAPQRIGFDP